MKGFEKAYLRGVGQKQVTSIHVGKQGLSEALLKEIDRQLEREELIKIRIASYHKEKDDLAERIAAESGATVIGIVGHTLLLYRKHPEPKKRRIRLPVSD